MLIELSVRNLGVVEELHLVLGPGLTAFTGETGAGKTLIVEAIALLTGGRADTTRVRQGADEAVVEGRFDFDGDDVVLRRVVAANGRSRAYVNGEMATVAMLGDRGSKLVDLHGQHDQQSLLTPGSQRRALDHFAGIDLGPLQTLRQSLRTARQELADLGGDAATRAREADLVRFQLDELVGANLDDVDEDDRLSTEQGHLADVEGDRIQGASALARLVDEGGAIDRIGQSISDLDGRASFAAATVRLRAVSEELTDVSRELRDVVESLVDDPARLDDIRERRQLLSTLGRKHGDGSVAGLIAARDALAERLDDLEHHDEHARRLTARIESLEADETDESARVHAARSAAAPELGRTIQRELRKLAMAHAEVIVDVGAGDAVEFLLAANPGLPPLPLAKVASGGELARTMLALRLVLTSAPPVLVFDEVDAGIGGSAATAVGAALATLGASHQVLVVTHLPQVAAAARTQVGVAKLQRASTTTTTVEQLEGDARVIELSRMLSGQPTSEAAQAHARDLLGAGESDDHGE